MWEVFNGKKSLGIIETNWEFASKYWEAKNNNNKRQ